MRKKSFLICFFLCLIIAAFSCSLLIFPFPSWIIDLCPEIFSEKRLMIYNGEFWVPTWISIISTLISLITALIANNISKFSFQSSFILNVENEEFKFTPINDVNEYEKVLADYRKNIWEKHRIKKKNPTEIYKFPLKISGVNTQILDYRIKKIKIKQDKVSSRIKDVRSKIVRNRDKTDLNIYFWIYKKSAKNNLLLDNLIRPRRHVENEYDNVSLELHFDVKTFNKQYKQKMIIYVDLKKSLDNNSEYEVAGYHIKVKN